MSPNHQGSGQSIRTLLESAFEEKDALARLDITPIDISAKPPPTGFPPLDQQLAELRRGVVQIVTEAELAAKLQRSIDTGRPLLVKLGIDPTAVDVHLGHTVPLRKLRQFQKLGHWPVIIIGEATALVGDPSGRDETRPRLTRRQVQINAQGYRAQVERILTEKNRMTVVHNSQWFDRMGLIPSQEQVPEGQGFKTASILDLASRISVARLLERDDFAQRIKDGKPIYLHECLYPLMQGYDSVMIRADVELGASEQLFNLMVGRRLQRDAGQEPQVAMTLPILVGTDGVRRMGKSLGNYIGVKEEAEEMFGKLMSIPDEAPREDGTRLNLIRQYFELLTDRPEQEVNELLAPGKSPRDAKEQMAKDIVAQYWNAEWAERAAEDFKRMHPPKHVQRQMPSTVEVHIVRADRLEFKEGRVWLPHLLREALTLTTSEARRLIRQGAVRIGKSRDHLEVVTDVDAHVEPDKLYVWVGKRRVCRISITAAK
ncbi:MAG: tyrosine--tRNA ligase [Planctomycetes bacterium]|nr:tyrosine--tRNA ligase [Planctomycetota bacterium]